jgi:hypothetical protein
MEVINVETGKAGILIKFAEIAPLGGVYVPELSNEIMKRYEFVQPPDYSPGVTQKDGIMFQMGRFKETDEPCIIRSLNIYVDGILADCASTEDALSVVTDVISWSVDRFGFRKPSVERDRVVLRSNLVVEFEGSTARAFDKFDGLFKMAANLFREQYNIERTVTMSRFGFDIDRTTITTPISSAPMFSIERQLNQPFSSGRFWCQAPVHTKDHVRLLNEFEALMKD